MISSRQGARHMQRLQLLMFNSLHYVMGMHVKQNNSFKTHSTDFIAY
jgi:hypothetical protein